MLRSSLGSIFFVAACAAPVVAALLAPGEAALASEGQKLAFLHDHTPQAHHGHGKGGCFVTTHSAHRARGIRHWREHCPHHEPHKLHHYVPKPHHRHHG